MRLDIHCNLHESGMELGIDMYPLVRVQMFQTIGAARKSILNTRASSFNQVIHVTLAFSLQMVKPFFTSGLVTIILRHLLDDALCTR